MRNADEANAPAKAKVALVDPVSMSVLWTNDPAFDASGPGIPLDQAVPMAEALGVPEALRTVAATGVSRHLRADVVSTARGSVALVASVYLLPDGVVLVLTENAWRVGSRKTGGSSVMEARARGPFPRPEQT